MHALDLSQQYFQEVALPALERDHPQLLPRMAAGLVGNGSECYGYDDELSQDHDWGTDFYLWLTEEDRERIPELQAWKQGLLAENPPEHPRDRSCYGADIRVMSVGDFYRLLIGRDSAPQSLDDWLRIPETNLSLVTNGRVFMDNLGAFSDLRQSLLAYVPEDLRRKRIAAKCMLMAQTGQYNLLRMAKRGDMVAARVSAARFVELSMELAYLLNRRFRPYYKWLYRGLQELPLLGQELPSLIDGFSSHPLASVVDAEAMTRTADDICRLFIDELVRQGLATSRQVFMTAQGEEVQAGISEPRLMNLPAQYEV